MLSAEENASVAALLRKLSASLKLGESMQFLPCVPARQPDLSLLERQDEQSRRAFISGLKLDQLPEKDATQWPDCEDRSVFSQVTDLYAKIVNAAEQDPVKLQKYRDDSERLFQLKSDLESYKQKSLEISKLEKDAVNNNKEELVPIY